MNLLKDIHHIALVTSDMDRLISFYRRIFDAEVTLDLSEGELRHAFIKIGPHTVLHPFQIPGISPDSTPAMFQRGHLDHFALNAASKQAFIEIYTRLKTEGATDGEITDMGSLWILTFTDPDQGRFEVVWRKPGLSDAATLQQTDWKPVMIDQETGADETD